MKYTSLKQDIISILSSTDSGLQLKMYDDEGNTTLQSDDATWVYIFNKNIMIEMMDDENPILCFWKDRDTLDASFKNIIQRIRELAILNGVSVQIRVYDNLDQRKIYNLIKSSIETKAEMAKEEEEMVESVNSNNELVEAFTKIISSAKAANRPSDFYLSEEMKSQNVASILNEMFGEVSNLKPLKSSSQQLSELFNRLMTATTRAEVDAILSETPSTLINKLSESVNDINNVSTFIRQKYENNVDFGNTTNNEIILENVKVYKVKVKNNHENLSNAYNKLLQVSEGVLDNLNLLKVIKQNKICETYNVSRKQLLDYYICGNNKPVKEQYAYVIENYLGEKTAFSSKLEAGIKALANYFNKGGEKDSQICKNIVAETIKYNQISDFILEYKDNYSARGFIPKFKKIFKECVSRLNEANTNYSNALFESIEETISYDSYLEALEESMKISHPAIKYLAIQEAKKDYIKSRMIMEEEDKDMKILVDELKHYSNYPSAIASLIISEGLKVKLPLTESVNKNNLTKVASMLYTDLNKKMDKLSSAVSSSLFNIIHTNKKLVESKVGYIKTLIKYSK